jgi:hypothetical protein
VKEEHADDVVSTLVHAAEVHQRIDTSRKRTVQPTTTLRDEFGSAFGNVSLALGRLHVRQMPLGAGFGDQFETQDTILSQEHVLLEDVHALDTLLAQLLGQRVIAVEVLFERATHDGTESIGREGTGQHTDVSERTLQRLVENVGDLVLEVLRGHERVDQVPPSFTQHGVDFTTRTTQILVVVEGFPQSQERLGTGFRTGIEQDTDFRVQNAAERVEQPTVGVDLLAVLLFQTEDHLHRGQSAGTVIGRTNQLLTRCHR